MINKLVRIAVVMTMIPAAVVGVAGPAKAWSYCNNPPENYPALYIYDNQGYCGERYVFSSFHPLECLYAGYHNNWAAAASNRSTSYKVTMYNGDHCDGENFSLAPRTSHPNLYSTTVGINGMGNEISSVKYSYP